MTVDGLFTDYIADALTSHIASTDGGSADFVLRQDDDLVYVDVEDGIFYLITVRKAEAHVASSPERSTA